MILKKQIIIPKEKTTGERAKEIMNHWDSDKDMIFFDGNFEIWEKDLETGGLVQLR